MTDIYLGIAVIFALGFFAFGLTLCISSQISRRINNLIAVTTMAGILAYFHLLWHEISLARFLPFSNLIVLGNWFPIGAGILAGCAWHHGPRDVLRRLMSPGLLLGTSVVAVIWPFLGTAPRCADNWSDDRICLQTTRDTCAPACAATLLRMHGILATEQEMAEKCFTRNGTTWMGLYHGLKKKTAGTQWDVEVVHGSFDNLRQADESPMIVTVGIDADEAMDQSHRQEHGWIPGVDHSVIILRSMQPRYVEVADPTPGIGREIWYERDLEAMWRGYGVRLIRR